MTRKGVFFKLFNSSSWAEFCVGLDFVKVVYTSWTCEGGGKGRGEHRQTAPQGSLNWSMPALKVGSNVKISCIAFSLICTAYISIFSLFLSQVYMQ